MKSLARCLIAVTLAALGAAAWAQTPAPAVDCEQKYKEVSEAAMKLAYWEFDQTEAGWRQLEPCTAQQSRLLQRYLRRQESEQRHVRWHLAQTLALTGDNAAAAVQAQQSVNPDEAKQHPDFSWNAYVLATVAFLRNDRAEFDRHYEVHRRAAQASRENEINFKVLVGLQKCFGKPYAQAYGDCRPD